jgi:hypothetical protein
LEKTARFRAALLQLMDRTSNKVKNNYHQAELKEEAKPDPNTTQV